MLGIRKWVNPDTDPTCRHTWGWILTFLLIIKQVIRSKTSLRGGSIPPPPPPSTAFDCWELGVIGWFMSFLLLLDTDLNTHSHHTECRARAEYGMIKSVVSDPDLDPHEIAFITHLDADPVTIFSVFIYSRGSGPRYDFPKQFRVHIQKSQTKADDPCGSRRAETLLYSFPITTLKLHRTRLGSTETVHHAIRPLLSIQ